jgi:hypothetical protein
MKIQGRLRHHPSGDDCGPVEVEVAVDSSHPHRRAAIVVTIGNDDRAFMLDDNHACAFIRALETAREELQARKLAP